MAQMRAITRSYGLFSSLRRPARLFPAFFSTTSSNEQSSDLRHTALHNFHLSHQGKMVPFAGWSMPVQYGDLSITNSTLHTRHHASLFDVSHMLQINVSGVDAEKYLETVCPIDLQSLGEGSGSLSVLTTHQGGIIDDCIITRIGPSSFYIVSNAGCAEKDMEHLNRQLQDKFSGKEVNITILEDRSLLALQGPKMYNVLQTGVECDLTKLFFMQSAVMDVFGIPDCRVTRCGYTGEDGVEISVCTSKVVKLAERLLEFEDVELAGLGARDILRLEAGLCLYGNDISEETTPIEAGLAWCISGRRRKEGGFNGSEVILSQLKNKPDKRRVGLLSEGPPARQGTNVLDSNGTTIGMVTSGGPSPMLKTNIAMAFVSRKLSKAGTQLQLQVRNKTISTKVVKMPFLPSNYHVK